MSDLERETEALLELPTSEEAAERVRALARSDGRLLPYAEAFEQRGERLVASGRRRLGVDSLLEAAQVFEEELDANKAATRLYFRVLEIDGGHRRALYSLGLLLHEQGRFDELIAVYRERLDSSHSDGERTTLHLYIAEIQSEHKNDLEAAFDELVMAARLAPRNLRILSRLEELGSRLDRLEDVAVVLGDLLMNQDDNQIRAGLSLRLAELYLGPLENEKRALVYLKSALVDDGGNPELLQELEDVFRERARFESLASLLEEISRDRRSGPHLVRLERELARLYERELGDGGRAIGALVKALRHAPEDRELLEEIQRVGNLFGVYSEVADAFGWAADHTKNPLLRNYLRLRLGRILEEELAEVGRAKEVYEKNS